MVDGYTRIPDDEVDAFHEDLARRSIADVPSLRKVTAVPATRRVRGIPSEVPLDEDDGMPGACVLNFDSVIVMPKSWFVEPICQLSPERMVQACRALAVAVGC